VISERTRKRLSAEVQRILAEVLEFEVKDPALRATFPTIMDVELSPDAQRAVVHVYVPGGTKERQAALGPRQGFFTHSTCPQDACQARSGACL